ncbi:hypothetical protein C7999DRAFT_39481 [Corynascus novoguineensis]|uniref:Nephrocystin 3-like N-terminal domain-containing protein n=1 Tax=Corynascus novoguineensis TaxID=1126955 RepID=A0AAN7CVZ7_9PEZI|nr:hypothetical protein C7999DRAFT_39481 [Corynascus novoguineensis]
MEGLGAAASTIAVVELAAKIASLCLKYSAAVMNAKTDIERLQQCTASLKTIVEGAQALLHSPHGTRLQTSQKLREALNNTYLQLGDIAAKLEAKLYEGRRAKFKRFFGLQALKWPFESNDVDKIIATLEREMASFSTALQVDQTAGILDINRKIDLTKLPNVTGAAFDSQINEHDPRCHPDTRVDLLAEIDRWIEDPKGKCIFWLCGMAGTGKSTISRTLAARFSARSILGASFLFKKGDGDRGKAAMLFTTIASQLVHRLPILAPHVRDAIDSDSAIADKNKGEQFQKLLLEPLNKCNGVPHIPTIILVVIDALDECDREEDAMAIIRILSKAKEVTSVALRFFITSRPELFIRSGFDEIHGEYQDMVLHRIPEPVVEHDISAFLRYELARIRDGYNNQALKDLQLPPDWPSKDDIRDLTHMAVPLFIFAATVCRFIADKGRSNPAIRLKKILEYQMAADHSRLDNLDATYLPILEQLISGRTGQDKTDVLTAFRDVVGPIILLAQPLSVRSLTRLLNVEAYAVHDQLNSLHSVLDISSHMDIPIRLFHLSFRDFLVDPTKRTTNDFWVDERKCHKTLADRCIQLMQKHLKKDICNLQSPGKLRSEIDWQIISTSVPTEVQYACQYWVYHTKESRGNVRDGGLVHSFLTRHLLHWLEALGLLGRISESIGMVDDLLVLLDVWWATYGLF